MIREAAMDSGIRPYRQIDPSALVGAIPLEECLELQAQVGDVGQQPPDVRFDYGWIGVEASMAMAQTMDPRKPRPINFAKEQARAVLRSVFRDENAPLALRMRARLVAA